MHIAVVLSGCGVYDGSEIHEATLTLLSIVQRGGTYQCIAPDRFQREVVNHITLEPDPHTKRHILEEAARIARGNILPLSKAKAADYDAVIFPGGAGAAKNLCSFLAQGAGCTIEADVLAFARVFKEAHKPAGFICIAPVMIPLIYPKGTRLTIGHDRTTATAIEAMGGLHVLCDVNDVVVDTTHKVVSTPAYMLAKTIAETSQGVQKLVETVMKLH